MLTENIQSEFVIEAKFTITLDKKQAFALNSIAHFDPQLLVELITKASTHKPFKDNEDGVKSLCDLVKFEMKPHLVALDRITSEAKNKQ